MKDEGGWEDEDVGKEKRADMKAGESVVDRCHVGVRPMLALLFLTLGVVTLS